MNLTTPLVLTSTLLLGACAAEPVSDLDGRDGALLPVDDPVTCPIAAQAHPGAGAIYCDNPDDLTTETGHDIDECMALEQRAQDLIAEHTLCTDDMQCDAVPASDLLGWTCTPAFACYLPVSTMTNVPRFVAQARKLDQDYAKACGCAVANCVSQDYVFSVCEGKSCSIAVDFPPGDL